MGKSKSDTVENGDRKSKKSKKVEEEEEVVATTASEEKKSKKRKSSDEVEEAYVPAPAHAQSLQIPSIRFLILVFIPIFQ